MKKYLVLTLVLALAFSCSHESLNEPKSVLEIEQESTLDIGRKLSLKSQPKKQSQSRGTITGLLVDIGQGGGSNGSGCPESNYGVSGDCNSGTFNGLVSEACILFNVNGVYENGVFYDLDIVIEGNSDFNLVGYRYQYSQGIYKIYVGYTLEDISPILIEVEDEDGEEEEEGNEYELELTQYEWDWEIRYIDYTEILYFDPCSSKFLD